MPRYLVQRTFPDGLQIPVDEQGAKTAMAVVDTNPAGLYSGTNPLVRPSTGVSRGAAPPA
jgi:hypothetical protein